MARIARFPYFLLVVGILIGGIVGSYATRILWVAEVDSLYVTSNVDLLRWELVLLRSHETQKGGDLSMEDRVKAAVCEHYEYAQLVADMKTDWSKHFPNPLNRKLVSERARRSAVRDLEFIEETQSDLLAGCE